MSTALRLAGTWDNRTELAIRRRKLYSRLWCSAADIATVVACGNVKRRQRRRYSVYATGWTVCGSNPGSVKIFSSTKRPHQLYGPPSPLFSWHLNCFPGVKRLGREADLSSPSRAEVKNKPIALLPIYSPMAWKRISNMRPGRTE
jgi:hypothetical protein